jgi:hypothetical protein
MSDDCKPASSRHTAREGSPLLYFRKANIRRAAAALGQSVVELREGWDPAAGGSVRLVGNLLAKRWLALSYDKMALTNGPHRY